MFDGEIMKKNLPLKNKIGYKKFLTKTESKTES